MKNVDITTSQNVTVQYTLAGLFERAGAFAIDLVALGLAFLLTLALVSIFGSSDNAQVVYFVYTPVFVLYSLAFEQLNGGCSLGKMLLKLRVVRLDGENATFLDYMMRWAFRGIDIYFSIGCVAGLSIVSSRYSQRVGDVLANTVVISVGKSERMTLQNLLNLHKTKDYQVTYPQVVKLREEHLLLVKETLSKSLRIDNAAHRQALTLLAGKLQKELQVKAPKDPNRFLKTLLQDYIVLTR